MLLGVHGNRWQIPDGLPGGNALQRLKWGEGFTLGKRIWTQSFWALCLLGKVLGSLQGVGFKGHNPSSLIRVNYPRFGGSLVGRLLPHSSVDH